MAKVTVEGQKKEEEIGGEKGGDATNLAKCE